MTKETKIIFEHSQKKSKIILKYGILDVTFHRDDFLTKLGSPEIGPSNITFDLNGLDINIECNELDETSVPSCLINELGSQGEHPNCSEN